MSANYAGMITISHSLIHSQPATGTSKKSVARPKTYGMSTGTTGLQSHLMKDHMHLWVATCNKLGVSIKGKAGRAA